MKIMNIKIDLSDVKKLEADLKKFKFRALPFATRQTVNDAAFKARTISQKTIDKKMVLRNKHAKNSVLVQQSPKTLIIRNQEAVTGSVADYMETQEFGGIKRGKRGGSAPIATAWSSGESENARPRKRLPKTPNTLRRIQLMSGKRKGRSKKQRNAIAVNQAMKRPAAKRFVYMETNKSKGIFKVVGRRGSTRIKMVHSLTKKSYSIPKTAWLKPSVNRVASFMPGLYRKNLLYQLRRNNLFKG